MLASKSIALDPNVTQALWPLSASAGFPQEEFPRAHSSIQAPESNTTSTFKDSRQTWHLQSSSLRINDSWAATNNTGRFTTQTVLEKMPGNLDVLRSEAEARRLYPSCRCSCSSTLQRQHWLWAKGLQASLLPGGYKWKSASEKVQEVQNCIMSFQTALVK